MLQISHLSADYGGKPALAALPSAYPQRGDPGGAADRLVGGRGAAAD